MKKFIAFLFCGFLTLFLTGCDQDLLSGSVDLVTNFECDAQIEVNNKKYECKVFHTPEGINTVTFSKPENIKGLTFLWESGKYKVSMKDLSGEFNIEPLSDNSFVSCIIKVLNSLNDKENLKRASCEEGEETLKGKCDNMDFDITVNSKGEIIRIFIPGNNITANFKYV